MKSLIGFAIGCALICFCSSAHAQCVQSSGGGGQGGGGQGLASFSQGGGQQGGFQGRLLTGPGSYFHDLMIQNYQQQQYQRQQAAIAAAKQAKKDLRKGKQLDTRRAQREAELARREERKQAARQELYGSNQVRLASSFR